MSYDSEKPLRLTKADLLKNHPIYLDSVLHHALYDPDDPYPRLYTHEIPEISLVVKGSGLHRIWNQTLPCKTGDLYILQSDIPHNYFLTEAGGTLEIKRLYFDAKDWLAGDAADLTNTRFCYGVFNENAWMAYAMLNEEKQAQITSLYDAIFNEMTNCDPEWREAVRAHLSMLLITVGRYISGAIKTFPSPHQTKEWGIVSFALRTVNERYADPTLTLEAISDVLYISKSHLSRLFKRLTGEPFSTYLRRIRLTHACRLLKDTGLTVEEIVRQCGMRDVPSFYRIFGESLHCTPYRYRTEQTKSISHLSNRATNEAQLAAISDALRDGRFPSLRDHIRQALDQSIPAQRILQDGLLHGMGVVGQRFKNNEIYVPEVLLAARAMKEGIQLLGERLYEGGSLTHGRVCIGTVQGDLHDIGKNLVIMMMEGRGLEVIDLGVDVAPEVFVRTAMEQNCQVICCSALLTTTMGVMEEVVKLAEKEGIRDRVKIMIGGAPVTEKFCREIGADLYTADAVAAAEAATRICKSMSPKT